MWFPFLILFLALPKQRLEFPRDDKIKLFHELWWEHFWSWRYTPADWNRFVDPPSTAETTEQQQKKFHLVDLRSSGIKVFPFFSPCLIRRNTRNVELEKTHRQHSCFLLFSRGVKLVFIIKLGVIKRSSWSRKLTQFDEKFGIHFPRFKSM